MAKEKSFLKGTNGKTNFAKFMSALTAYDADKLEIKPNNPHEIYQYYILVDGMYIWLKNAYEDNLCVLCNEMRAILGHLSEYSSENEKEKENLEKAYGHLRRLSIDILKTLCDAFDKIFDGWINKHARYDYKNIDADYFPQYVTLYNKAHCDYLDAQKSENMGSDRGNKIICKYYEAAKSYSKLYEHHMDDRRIGIEKITRRLMVNNVIWISCTIILSILSILEKYVF